MTSRIRLMRDAAGLMLVTSILVVPGPVRANVWVFEPSASLDQRVDDNYRLDTEDPQQIAATRAVGSLSIRNESERRKLKAFLRVDGLLSVSDDDNDELTSNQIAYLQSRFEQPRSVFDVKLSFKRDTPNRDISADITDPSATAADTGASVTQDHNIDRTRIVLNPTFTYNVTRRFEMDLGLSFTQVAHGTTSCEDAIRAFGAADPDTVFTVRHEDELDDFEERAAIVTGRYRLSALDTVTTTLSFSQFDTETEIADAAFEDKTADENCRNVLRDPKETSTVETSRVLLGYQRQLSRTLVVGGNLGYFEADDSTGYLAGLSINKDAGLVQYAGNVGIEVYPSDIGDVVESLNIIGDVKRELNPLMDFHFRMRAYEPDAISDSVNDNKFARRFLSLEPKVIWRFSRAWTAAASYRYRRQKSQGNPESAQSHALLFSIKYTPPSAIADALK